MNILGISAGFHDAAATVINTHGDILFAAHSERYSKQKNDSNLCYDLLRDVMDFHPICHVAYYETPWKKQLRRLYSGEGVEWKKLSVKRILTEQFGGYAHIPSHDSNWKEVLISSWTIDDMAILSMILTFWFVGRVWDAKHK